MGHTLRVASYNVRNLKDDQAAAVRVVRAVGPDVLCLQEVPRHPFSGHRIAGLASRCGLLWSGGHRGSGGTTVLSSPRLQVDSARHERLQGARLQRQRGYAVTALRLPGHRAIAVVSIHLSLDADERARHAGGILAAARPADGPLVLAGDLNEGPDGRAWTAIASQLRPVSRDAPTFSARNPRRRLDVIFATASLRALEDTPVDLDPADLVAASDHLPVWADLDLADLELGPDRRR